MSHDAPRPLRPGRPFYSLGDALVDTLEHWCCPPGAISGAFKEHATREHREEHQRIMAGVEALCIPCGRFHPLDDTHLRPDCDVENATLRLIAPTIKEEPS